MRKFRVTKQWQARNPFLLVLALTILLSLPMSEAAGHKKPAPLNAKLQAQYYGLRQHERQRGRRMHFEKLQAQYEVDCTQASCLALTFDDGPNPKTTPQVLSELEAAHVPATFFVIGKHIAGNQQLLVRMFNDGFEIGNHTWSHTDLTKLTPQQVKQEISQTQDAIANAGGIAPTLFRPPFEALDPAVESEIPLKIMLWNEDPKDWKASTSQEVVQAVEASAHPGGIVDMHDIYHVTADALPQIITDLSGRGFHFVTVSQLLKMDPDNDHVFYGFKAH